MADEIAEICKVADNIIVSYFEDEFTTDDDHDFFRSFLMHEIGVPFYTTAQHGTDTFERMSNAFSDAYSLGSHEKILLVGCDLPEMKSSDLNNAFDMLNANSAVINPSSDGGYWLVGMNKFEECIFKVSHEGGSEVLSDTLHICGNHRISVGVGRILEDVDVPEDLFRLYSHRQQLPPSSLTKAFLDNFEASRFELSGACGAKVSVIVPIYNEESTVEQLIDNLSDVCEQAEIIFVDGGSTDRTIEILRNKSLKNSYVIQTGKGRAHQMNEGAKVAKGDVYMFLHADCIPPKNLVSEVRQTLKSYNWGCFGVKFDDSDPLMTICQIISNNRIHDRKVVFGDQGIFIKRELFEEIGGFPEFPIM